MHTLAWAIRASSSQANSHVLPSVDLLHLTGRWLDTNINLAKKQQTCAIHKRNYIQVVNALLSYAVIEIRCIPAVPIATLLAVDGVARRLFPIVSKI